MAKSKLSKTRNITESVKVSGHLNQACNTITYESEDGEKQITINDCLRYFADRDVAFSISLKYDENLDEEEF